MGVVNRQEKVGVVNWPETQLELVGVANWQETVGVANWGLSVCDEV